MHKYYQHIPIFDMFLLVLFDPAHNIHCIEKLGRGGITVSQIIC